MELNAWTASANQPTTAPRADQLNVNVIAVHSHYMLLDAESYTVHPITPRASNTDAATSGNQSARRGR